MHSLQSPREPELQVDGVVHSYKCSESQEESPCSSDESAMRASKARLASKEMYWSRPGGLLAGWARTRVEMGGDEMRRRRQERPAAAAAPREANIFEGRRSLKVCRVSGSCSLLSPGSYITSWKCVYAAQMAPPLLPQSSP